MRPHTCASQGYDRVAKCPWKPCRAIQQQQVAVMETRSCAAAEHSCHGSSCRRQPAQADHAGKKEHACASNPYMQCRHRGQKHARRQPSQQHRWWIEHRGLNVSEMRCAGEMKWIPKGELAGCQNRAGVDLPDVQVHRIASRQHIVFSDEQVAQRVEGQDGKAGEDRCRCPFSPARHGCRRRSIEHRGL